MQRTSSLAVVTFVFAACGANRGGITGRVLDDTGAPVAGAVVESDPTTDTRLTNTHGRFAIVASIDTETGAPMPLVEGQYRIVIRRVGYEELRADVQYEDALVDLGDVVLRIRDLDVGDEVAPVATPEPRVDHREPGIPVSHQ